MNKHFFTLFCAVLLAAPIWSQKGKIFPKINGQTLDGKAVGVPVNNGKYTVIGIAYHRKAEDALKQWLNPLYYTFIKKSAGKSQFDASEIYDVNFAFIPMISGFKKIAEEFKRGTQKEFWPYIVDTDKTDITAIQEQLGVKDTRIPYFYILDSNGKILEVQSGDFSEAKMEKLEDAAAE